MSLGPSALFWAFEVLLQPLINVSRKLLQGPEPLAVLFWGSMLFGGASV